MENKRSLKSKFQIQFPNSYHKEQQFNKNSANVKKNPDTIWQRSFNPISRKNDMIKIMQTKRTKKVSNIVPSSLKKKNSSALGLPV